MTTVLKNLITQNLGSVITGVTIVNTTYQFSCTSATLFIGQQVVISGTLGGTGTISGFYGSPTTYYITSTNGTTGFSLSLTYGGSNITTTTGTPTGLTYAISTTVFTSNAAATTTIIGMSFTNTTQDQVLVNVRLTDPNNWPNGGYYLYQTPVPAFQSLRAVSGGEKLVMQISSTIQVTCSVPTSIDLVMSWVELS
jgi:hypothetical protein